MEQQDTRKKTRKKKHTADAVIAAIRGSAGIKKTIAQRLNIHRHTVDDYLLVFPSVATAYKNEIDAIGDMVEEVILDAIRAHDLETARWYAKTKLRHRGYSERIEIREIRELSDEALRDALAQRLGMDMGTAGRSRPASPHDPTTIH